MDYLVAMPEGDLRRGPWLEEEDEQLISIVGLLGERKWDALAKSSGLRRSGKSCRLRWMNYLRPNLKHGPISAEEDQIILQLHQQWGNKWSRIARQLPGRTDNEIKNYWKSHLRKMAQVQEQANMGSGMKDVKQKFSTPNNEEGNVRSSSGYCLSREGDISGTSVDSSYEFVGLPNFGYANSPYERRVSDWISSCSWSYEQSGERKQLENRECYSLEESCFSYQQSAWISEESDTIASIWDSSCSIWDMD